jgi:hypothetical protein
MKLPLVIASTLVIAASAFAPVQQQRSSSVRLNAWISEQVGIVAPTNFFDPLGLSKNKSDAVMIHHRESELKHGRVAMAACLGWYLTAGGVHPAFNSELSSDPIKAMVELPLVGWMQIVFTCGAVEWLAEKIKERPGYEPGDLLGAAYWVDNSDAGWVDYQNKELTNGRLAMLAFMGIFVQDLYFGDYGDEIFKSLVK